MPVFAYVGQNTGGGTARGTITADSPRQARDLLRARGIVVTQVRDSRSAPASVPFWTRLTSRGLPAQWTAASQELSMLLHAGIPLLEAIDTLAKQQTGPFRVVLLHVRDRVAAGASLAEALSERPDVFDAASIHLVEVGENAGNLEEVLGHLADFRMRLAETKDEVVTTLVYPAFLLVFGMAASIFLMTSVMPPLLENLQETLPVLPWPTLVVKTVSEFLVSYGLLVAGVAVGIVLLFLGYIRSDSGQVRWHRLLLKLPLFGPMLLKQGLARIAMIISMLLKSGIVLTQAFDRVILTEYQNNPRAVPVIALEETSRELLASQHRLPNDFLFVSPTPSSALELAARLVSDDEMLVICGSFFLASEIMLERRKLSEHNRV